MFSGREPIAVCFNAIGGLRHLTGDYLSRYCLFSDDGNCITITTISDLVPPTSVVINHPFSATKDFYYEGKMTNGNNSVALGLIPEEYVLPDVLGVDENGVANRVEGGWDFGMVWHSWPAGYSYTYHGDTGKVWHEKIGKIGGCFLQLNDVVGCGYNYEKSHIFFTLNGQQLENTFHVVRGSMWYPTTAYRGDAAEFEVNLGKKAFVYQPTMIPSTIFPVPASLSQEWTQQINGNSQLNENHDHLKDVTIVSKDGHEIKCYGVILSIRSEVFQKMLRPTKNGNNMILMKDFDAQTIRKMLMFMYSDKLKEDEVDMELLGASNMYQVESLQNFCEIKLCNELDVNNVLDAWVGANLFNRYTFLEICESFIISNWLEIQKTESFSRIMQENLDGMASLMLKLLNVHSNSKKKEDIGSEE